MFIYLAQAIDLSADNENTKTVIESICGITGRLGCITFRPAQAYYFWPAEIKEGTYMHEIDRLIQLNYSALARSDLSIFVWDGSPTWGLQLEFQFVVERGCPYIFIDLSNRDTPLYLLSLLKGSTPMGFSTEIADKEMNTILSRMIKYVADKPHWKYAKIHFYEGKKCKHESNSQEN